MLNAVGTYGYGDRLFVASHESRPIVVAMDFIAEAAFEEKITQAGGRSLIIRVGSYDGIAVKETVEEIANLVDARRLHTE